MTDNHAYTSNFLTRLQIKKA